MHYSDVQILKIYLILFSFGIRDENSTYLFHRKIELFTFDLV